MQSYKQDEYREMLYLCGCGTYFLKDTFYQLGHYALPPEGRINIFCMLIPEYIISLLR